MTLLFCILYPQLTEEESVTSDLIQISESSNVSTTETKSSSSSIVATTTHVIKQGRTTNTSNVTSTWQI